MAAHQPLCSSGHDLRQESYKDSGTAPTLCCHISLPTCNPGAPGHGSRQGTFKVLLQVKGCPCAFPVFESAAVQLARSLATTIAYCWTRTGQLSGISRVFQPYCMQPLRSQALPPCGSQSSLQSGIALNLVSGLLYLSNKRLRRSHLPTKN